MTCKVCECGAANKIIQMHEQEKVHQFLIGPNDDTYSSIQNQILTYDQLPSLDRIFNMVMQEENHKSIMLGSEDRSETDAAYATMTERAQHTVTEKARCKHYGRFRHDESNFYELIEYPPGWGTHG